MYFTLTVFQIFNMLACFENHWCSFTALLSFVVCCKLSCTVYVYYVMHFITEFEPSSNISSFFALLKVI